MSEFERRKEYLIRSLFYDSPDLSTIPEDSDELSQAPSPLFPPDPHRLDTPNPPPAHTGGLWSPLPPLTIEIVKEPNKHDEPEEFYKRLHRKILKIYNRIFFEDRSDISDINTSGDDDTPTHDEPIDYSTSRIELIDSTLQSVNDMAADQENHKNITTDDTKNQRSSEEIELLVNEPDDGSGSRNEKHDDKSNNVHDLIEDDEGGLDNLEPDDDEISNLEDNVESYDGRVSSSTDIVASSTESDEYRNSVTPLSSTVVLSQGTSVEEICLERNEDPPNATHHIDPEAEETQLSRSSSRLLTGSLPRVESIHNEDNVDIVENMETNNEEIRETDTPGSREGTPDKDMEINASLDTHNNSVQTEVEEMRTPRPHHSIGSPTHHNPTKYPIEPNVIIVENPASLESDTNEEEMPSKTNNSIQNPDNLDLFDLVRISSPKEIIEDNTNVIVECNNASVESDSNEEEEMPTKPNKTKENTENLDLFDLLRTKEIIEDNNTNIINPFSYFSNSMSSDSRDLNPENNSVISHNGKRKRKSLRPCGCTGKVGRFSDKSVQTDLNLNGICIKLDINLAERNVLIDNLRGTKVVFPFN